MDYVHSKELSVNRVAKNARKIISRDGDKGDTSPGDGWLLAKDFVSHSDQGVYKGVFGRVRTYSGTPGYKAWLFWPYSGRYPGIPSV